jgi:hypothetical protein
MFCCYAFGDKEDEPLFDSLDRQLQVLRNAGLITTWSRRDIAAGASSAQEVRQQLTTSDLVLLLVSPSLQASECWEFELQLALARCRAGQCELVPVRLRPVLWKLMPFSDLQPLPTHSEAVTKAPSLDDGWLDVLSGLQPVVERLADKPLCAVPAVADHGPLGLSAYFQAVHDKINVLGDYKQLHDRLHQLQFQVYNVLVVESRRYPEEEVAADNLLTYQETLRDIVEDVLSLLARPSFTGREQSWLKRLTDAKEALDSALRQRSAELLGQAIRLLRRVLVREPSLINRSLTEAAHLLRMDVSSTRLVDVLPAYPQLLRGEAGGQWEAKIKLLGSTTESLDALVKEHDQWQSVSDLLWPLESAFVKNLDEFADAWPDLYAPVSDLVSGKEEDWAKDLMGRATEIDRALGQKDAVALRRAFALYHRRANLRFFHIDTQLREKCEQLRNTATELLQTLRQVVQK